MILNVKHVAEARSRRRGRFDPEDFLQLEKSHMMKVRKHL